ncbi:MAG: GNAT family N-acetyltransferase [Clostridia bacterium]|jgi:mycothiol synthase|nr:GNAT family N-acetyltransferase [Clostridia bacterium]
MNYVDYLMMYKKVEPKEFQNEFNGFTFRKFNGSENDIKLWYEICKCGIIRDDETLESSYRTRLIEHIGYNPDTIFFIIYEGKEVATVTALTEKTGTGWLHMVTAKPDVRGKGVAQYLISIAEAALYKSGMQRILLQTKEFRSVAIKAYLKAGYKPVLYTDEMESRWTAFLNEYGYSGIEAVDENGNFTKILK